LVWFHFIKNPAPNCRKAIPEMASRSRKLLTQLVERAKHNTAINNWLRYNPLYYGEAIKLLHEVDKMGADERLALQNQLTARVLKWARDADVANSNGSGLEQWPILEKDDIRQNPGRNHRILAVPASTGGTTGIPIQLWRSLQSIAVEQAFLDSIVAPFGLQFRSARIAVLRGANVKAPSDRKPPYGVKANAGKHLVLSSPHLRGETVDWYYVALARFRPEILYIYPSAGENLAVRMLERDLRLPVPLVMASSEMLHPGGRETIKAAFGGAAILDHYGMAERGVFAHSTKENEFWLNPAYGRVELIPAKADGLPPEFACADIIGTGFWNRAMPLVRYRTGDRLFYPAHYSTQDLQDVSLGLKPFAGILGRDKDYLVSPRGELLTGMDHLPREVAHVVRMQIIQESLNRVRILVVPADGFCEADRELLMANVGLKIPDDMQVKIELVERLAPSPGGKVPYVVRLV
jgi:phenylacetate-CoA ligase